MALIQETLGLLEKADAPSRFIDRKIGLTVVPGLSPIHVRMRLAQQFPGGTEDIPHYTSCLATTVSLLKVLLPGWNWTCKMTDSAGCISINPSISSTKREPQHVTVMTARQSEGCQVEWCSGDSEHRVCIALLTAILRVAAKAGSGDGN